MLWSEAITALRRTLSDDKATYRVSDLEAIDYLYGAVKSLWSVHPEAFFVDDIVTEPPAKATAGTDTLLMDEIYLDAIVHHAAHKLYLQDAESQSNLMLSDKHLELWRTEI
jgi:hypothetical protein